MDRVTGGSLEVSAGRADEGETVTITAAPDDGYELKKLTVTDSQDGAVRVQNAGEGRYTFVMPGGGVTVSASFVRSGEQTELPFTECGQRRVLLRCGPVGCGAGDRLRCHRNGLRPGPRMHTGPACDLPVAGKRLS